MPGLGAGGGGGGCSQISAPGAKATCVGLGSQISRAIGDHKSREPPSLKSPTAAKGSSRNHVQGLRWSQRGPGDRVAKESLIGRDDSPVRHIKLGAVRVPGGGTARAGPATDSHRGTWLWGLSLPA